MDEGRNFHFWRDYAKHHDHKCELGQQRGVCVRGLKSGRLGHERQCNSFRATPGANQLPGCRAVGLAKARYLGHICFMTPTNSVPSLDIPGLNLLPVSWQGPVLISAVLFPYVTRAWHGWVNGGGFVGAKNAVLFGTNVPKTTPSTTP